MSFLFINKTLQINSLKTRAAMNSKISVFVVCVQARYIRYYKICMTVPLRTPFFIEHLRWLLVISEKTQCVEKFLLAIWEMLFLHENNCNCMSYKFSYKSASTTLTSFPKNTKAVIKFSVSWWPDNEKYFCFLFPDSCFKSKACLVFYKEIVLVTLLILPFHAVSWNQNW